MRKFLTHLAVVVTATLGTVAVAGPAQAAGWRNSGQFARRPACVQAGIDLVRLHPRVTNYRCIGRGYQNYLLQTYWI